MDAKEIAFRRYNSWNLSYEELIRFSYRHPNFPDPDTMGDTVYVNGLNYKLTRSTAIEWAIRYFSFSAGWNEAMKVLGKDKK